MLSRLVPIGTVSIGRLGGLGYPYVKYIYEYTKAIGVVRWMCRAYSRFTSSTIHVGGSAPIGSAGKTHLCTVGLESRGRFMVHKCVFPADIPE